MDALGTKLTSFGTQVTQLEAIKAAYAEFDGVVRRRDESKLLDEAVKNIQLVLAEKVKAVEKVVKEAERANEELMGQTVKDSHLEATYLNAKDVEDCDELLKKIKESWVETTAMPVEETSIDLNVTTIGQIVDYEEAVGSFSEEIDKSRSDQVAAALKNCTFFEYNAFFGMKVNFTHSGVHVPTNIYKKGATILRGAQWSKRLDRVFRSNAKDDRYMSWQYFGSADGFMRIYPGTKWPYNDNVDLYDCRTRNWYISAAASPKDIIILVDISGSMTGLRMGIAKHTVRAILDTLGDNDFFNVIAYSKALQYVEPCFNRTLVQATFRNRQRAMDGLEHVDTSQISDLGLGLVEAFEIFQLFNESRCGALCNRAIAVISDFTAREYLEIFEEYNWPDKPVRIFTFVIGRETTHSRQFHWMSCANKGYYSHVSTLADIQENVQFQQRTFGIPLGLTKSRNFTGWTSVFIEARPNKGEYHLVTSIAQPVFNFTKKNQTRSDKVLLGVVGTDVPIHQLQKFLPPHRLGVNGYSFAITNNGFILYHPDLRPRHERGVKPHYDSVDLGEVEINASVSADREDFFQQYSLPLREAMIDRQHGSLEMDVKQHFDNMRRIKHLQQTYHYAPVEGSPFSFGIAYPSGYDGLRFVDWNPSIVDLTKERGNKDIITNAKLKVAKWIYCENVTLSNVLESRTNLAETLKLLKNSSRPFNETCNSTYIYELIKNVVVDDAVIDAVMTSWYSKASDDVELVLLGTNSGLSAYWPSVGVENMTRKDYVYRFNNTIEETYYKRAVDAGEGNFVFWTPFDAGTLNATRSVVYGATGIFRNLTDADDGDRQHVMPLAVVLFQMKYEQFIQSFLTGDECADDQSSGDGDEKSFCALRCTDEDVNCYLLDEHGYIVAARNSLQVGLFYGNQTDSEMATLIEQRQLYTPVYMPDFQGVNVKDPKKKTSGSSIPLNPFTAIWAILQWIINEVVFSLMSFSLLSVFDSSNMVTDATPIPNNIGYFAFISMPRKRMLLPSDKEFTLYRLNESAAANPEPIVVDCEVATKTISYAKVSRTNLLFVAVHNGAICPTNKPLTVEPQDIPYSAAEMCDKLRLQRHRERPKQCHWTHPEENSTFCGRASTAGPPTQLVGLAVGMSWLTVAALLR